MNAATSGISQNIPEGKGRFPLSLLCLTLGAFAIGMTEFIIMGLLPNVAEDLNVSISQAGQLISSYALGVAVGAPLLTILTRKMPQKKLLIFLMAIFIAGNAFSAVAPTYGLLIGARVVTAFAHGTFLGVGSLMAAGLVRPDRRAGAVSMVLAGLTISNIIGVPFGTFIGQQLGWRASFGAITILGLISLVGIVLFIPAIQQKEEVSLAQELKGVLQPQVLLMLLTGAFGCASLFAMFTYITPSLEQISGFAEHEVTCILVLFGVGVTLGNLLGGRLADWKLMPSLIINFTVIAVLLSLLTVALPNPYTAVVAVFLWGVAAFGIMPGVQVRIMNLAHEAPLLASTSSHSALNLGNAGGAFLGGLVITYVDLAYVPLVASLLALCGVGGAVLSYWLGREKG
ncbi:DHA1 family inner membrane transport protein [Paenibacillus shirakamiensis]|uniref:DHA1 family inner membrane transport protein n=1 Tax=Paenibacillus shirakamiensis TaxID=1265935 RepID=A0ABS4JGD7_9BACL|nr:MFS transporter [Paenibacillus shirakamiensis]MBP2000773.1 DHA1 family inner membrane transport protein [Paenibacillus shirakamiensis]